MGLPLLKDGNLGNLLFVGLTGVGKTELCKALEEFLFDDKDTMVNIDLFKFFEKHTMLHLIGALLGYVRYNDRSEALTKSVR